MAKIVEQSVELIDPKPEAELLSHIEQAARTCYRSEHKVEADSAKALFAKLLKSGHHSQFEHVTLSVRLVCDRGVSHELVRHRIGVAFSQESTRYCNYGKEQFERQIAVTLPAGIEQLTDQGVPTPSYLLWKAAIDVAEHSYLRLLELGISPQVARSVLPTCLATTIVLTANLREWYHIFNLRLASGAHPDMKALMRKVLAAFVAYYPTLFRHID